MGVYKRANTYWINYMADGKLCRESVGRDKRLAEQVLYTRRLAIVEGKFFPQRNRSSIPFREMADMYWKLHAKQMPSAQVTKYQLIMLSDFFDNTPLDRITIPDILQYLNGVKERASAATANRHHNTLRAIFNRAIEWEKLNGPNPAAKVKQFRIENSRTRFLEIGDITRLLAACDTQIQPIVSFAILTGMRRGEILNLRWEHLDLTNGIIHVLKTKSGEPREIPLAPDLAVILADLRKGDGGPVFNMDSRLLNTRFSKALMLAGITDFRFHDLRHTFASHFVMRTNDLPTLQKLLGHKSPRMTQRYAHLSKGHLQVEMQVFAAGFSQIFHNQVNPMVGDAQKETADRDGLPSKNDALKSWSGRRESNPHLNLGKVAYYHCTTPALLPVKYSACIF